MRQTAFLLSFTITILSILFSCTEPTPIGAELLEEDQANLEFSNTIPISAKTIAGTPIPSYSPFINLQLPNYLLGEADDSNFGKSTASIYTQVSRSFDAPFTDGTFDIDSIVLSINYDASNSVGSFSEPISLEIHRLAEDLFSSLDYTSDQTFRTGDNVIGEATFIPSLIDSFEIGNYISGTDSIVNTVEPAHLRIPLDIELARELLDPNIYIADTTFVNFFKGMHVRPVTSNGGFVSLNFNSSISRITLYYRSDRILYEYRFPFTIGNGRNSLLVHEPEGGAINEALNDENADFLYLQSMAGPNIEINFPDVSGLENIVVNKAELELTVATEESEIGNFSPVSQIVALNLQDDGLNVIDDILSALLSPSSPINTDVFGGVPVTETVDGVTLTRYRINLSSYFQSVLDGDADPTLLLTAGATQNAFYLSIPPKGGRGNSVVLYGPNHPEHAPKLNLIFTDL